MKLKIFRIASLVAFLLVGLLGIGLAIFNIVLANNGTREESSFLILLISFLIGAFFCFFEAFFIIKSFKEGTLLLHHLAIKEKHYVKNKAPFIVLSIISLLAVIGLVFNILIYTNLIKMDQSLMTSEFNIYYCLIILLNGLDFVIYYLFVAVEDIEIAR